eukprot:TRINITY_DN16866_c0_g1_i1.p1 TRINITY_DN16866_c0_g1~~TRINITY_DN16866_c0_g1_i1.p1  ORF type:complete len:241 (+),score=46.44 TRINITY_DN16866_c0_g1_i1:133-855(+)
MNKVDQSGSARTIEEINSISESQIQSLYSTSKSKEKHKPLSTPKPPTRNELLNYIQTRGLADDMRKYLIKQHPLESIQSIDIDMKLETNGLQIKVEILNGNNFSDYNEDVEDRFVLCSIASASQRFSTGRVKVSSAPEFNKEFIFRMKLLGSKLDLEEALHGNERLDLVLIEESRKTRKLISMKRVEWRHALYSKITEQEVMLTRMNLHDKTPLGSILSLIHICRCRRYAVCRSRWSPYH